MSEAKDTAFAFQAWLCSVDRNTLVTEGDYMRCEECGRLFDAGTLVDEGEEDDD